MSYQTNWEALYAWGIYQMKCQVRGLVPLMSLCTWCVSIFLIALTAVEAIAGGLLSGRSSVIDGDTIEIHGEHVRLNGIDAPEASQLCADGSGRKYRCGAASANALAEFLETSVPISCTYVARDRYGRFVGDCSLANGSSVQEWLVSSGYALDWPKYSHGKYSALQEAARVSARGVWKGEFQTPWEWRTEHKGEGPKKDPLLPLASAAAVNACAIKGNINSKGERIFHTPGQRDYQRTKISEGKGERWFCLVEEAIAAGWRPATR